jgi:hypothetical protein
MLKDTVMHGSSFLDDRNFGSQSKFMSINDLLYFVFESVIHLISITIKITYKQKLSKYYL